MDLSKYLAPLNKALAPLDKPRAAVLAWFRTRPKGFWPWLAGTFVAGLLSLVFLYRIIGVLPEELGQDAFYHGRRVTLDLSSGEAVGGSHSQSAVSTTPGVKSMRGARALAAAPYEEITEYTAAGPLPKPSENLLPWQYYGKAYSPASQTTSTPALTTQRPDQARHVCHAANDP